MNKLLNSKHLHRTLALSLLAVMVILGLSSAANHQASAAAGVAGLSVTSSASSYQVGSTFTVTITDNGTDAINSVQANINYDSAVLTEQSISTGTAAGSPLTTTLGTPTVANNQIQISVGDLGNVAGDTGPLTVAKITFLVTATGSTSISPDSSSKIYLAIGSTNSYSAGSSVPLNLTLTAVPNPTCASIGKTGTYPNCVTPTPTPTCASQGKTGTYPNCVASTTNNTTTNTTNKTTSPETKNSTPGNTTTTPTLTNTSSLTISNIEVQNINSSSADISWQTNLASSGTINYGTSTSYGNILSDSSLGTNHMFSISNLKKGTTYHYSLSGKTANGLTAVSSDGQFKTIGFTLTIQILDTKNLPIKGAKVTALNKTLITDSKGFVIFTNQLAGPLNLTIKSGNATTSKSIDIGQISKTTSAYLPQNFKLIVTRGTVSLIYYVIGGLAILVIIGTLYFSRYQWKQEYVEVNYLVRKAFKLIKDGEFFSSLTGAVSKSELEKTRSTTVPNNQLSNTQNPTPDQVKPNQPTNLKQ